jgi:hypothetical protein
MLFGRALCPAIFLANSHNRFGPQLPVLQLAAARRQATVEIMAGSVVAKILPPEAEKLRIFAQTLQ